MGYAVQGDNVKKRKRRASIIIWIVLVAVIRVLYMFLNLNSVTDQYGYFEHAMIRAGESEAQLSSGLSFAYTNTLSKVLLLCGNRMEAVMIFQTVLQLLALYLFLRGVWCIWGRLAAFVSATFLAVMPFSFRAIHNVEPTGFILFHFMLILFLMGNFYILARQQGWRRSSLCELYLMVLGIYLGVVCTWNYTGVLLVLLFGYILARNHILTREFIWQQDRELLKEKDQIMSTFSQGMIVFLGVLLGMFITLMKYTGISGDVISGQLKWWLWQYTELPGMCQGTELQYAICLLMSIVLAVVCHAVQLHYRANKEAEMLLQKINSQKAEGTETQTGKPETAAPVTGTTAISEKAQEEAVIEPVASEQVREEEILVGNGLHTTTDSTSVSSEKDKQTAVWENLSAESGKDTQEADGTQNDYFVAKDGKKIRYLDNPLPVPKKHVERHLDFDFDISMDDIMAFDREMDDVEEWERKK